MCTRATTTQKMTAKLIFFTMFTVCIFAYAQVDDYCRLRDSQKRGTCKLVSDCPQVQDQARQGISPTLCGFDYNSNAIVCCEDDSYESPSDFIYPDQDNRFPSQSANDRIRTSERKCDEYSRSTEGVVQAIPLVPHTEPINISVVKCEFSGVPLIVGGEPAAAGEFPFMALIGFNSRSVDEKWRCGATLISDQYVVTAAHCTHSRDAGQPTVVRLGELDILRTDDGSSYVDYSIGRIIVHPDYRYPQKYNDIALIQLTNRVEFTKFIRPACLHTKEHIKQSKGIATGWGKTDYLASGRSYRLLKVLLNFYDNAECTRVFKESKFLPRGVESNMLCAGDLKGGRDTCKGDSGGPLIVTKEDNNCKFYIVGITSFGKFCGASNTPAIYTRISKFVEWIEDIVW